jgi:bifunctional non-homologous end joining protein LigD
VLLSGGSILGPPEETRPASWPRHPVSGLHEWRTAAHARIGQLHAVAGHAELNLLLVTMRKPAAAAKRCVSPAVKAGRSQRDAPLTQFVRPQLSRPVEKPPSGPRWLDEIKLDARIDNGHAQLLTRTGLDWTAKYPGVVAALANLNVKTAYIDGELCGVDDAGLPSFAQTQAPTDGKREVRLVYYAFDLLHLAGWDLSSLPLVRRKELLEPLVANKPGLERP